MFGAEKSTFFGKGMTRLHLCCNIAVDSTLLVVTDVLALFKEKKSTKWMLKGGDIMNKPKRIKISLSYKH